MKSLLSLVDQLHWGIIIIFCATLGLAPFSPPHIVEKLSMLIKGNLIRPIDWFDLLLHGFPWIILILKVIALSMKKG
jgi:hypothetical protein